jgi:hypothetical protein
MSTEQELDQLLDRPFVFRERPQPASGDLRAVWRLPVLLLLVRACRGGKATPEQLHVLNWAVRSAESAERLVSFLGGNVRPEEAIVRFEPALDRAVALARGFELLVWSDRYWTLTEQAREFLKRVDAEKETLRAEKDLLKRLPGPLPQAAVQRLLGRGTK